jgi:hypothetical protein
MTHSEVRVQHDPIHAIVAAAQQILIERAQPIHYRGYATSTVRSTSNCPEGATFSQPSLRKSVDRYGGGNEDFVLVAVLRRRA